MKNDAIRKAVNAVIRAFSKTNLCVYSRFDKWRCKGCHTYTMCDSLHKLKQSLRHSTSQLRCGDGGGTDRAI